MHYFTPLPVGMSFDHMSRLLVDIHQDSSHIAENLLSAYQRSLLQTLYSGHSLMRTKYTLIMTRDLDPMMPAAKYMDKGDYENELKQVIGDTRSSHDLGHKELVIFGRDGMLISGTHVGRHEEILIEYVGLQAREHVMRMYFRRTFNIADVLSQTRVLINNYTKDPGKTYTIYTNGIICSTDTISHLH